MLDMLSEVAVNKALTLHDDDCYLCRTLSDRWLIMVHVNMHVLNDRMMKYHENFTTCMEYV